MITGAHIIIYSTDAESDRVFIRDVLGFREVDAGDGWLIFKLPPAEVAVHPTDKLGKHEFYLMCDDIESTLADLTARGVEICSPISDKGGVCLPRSSSPAAPSFRFISHGILSHTIWLTDPSQFNARCQRWCDTIKVIRLRFGQPGL